MDPSSHSTGNPTPRAPASYEPITSHEDESPLGESFQSTETIRRRLDTTYGSIQSTPPHPAGNNQHHERPARAQYERSHSKSSLAPQSPVVGPERARPRPRRPGIARSLASPHAPHRGAYFSVDDDISEIQAEQSQRAAPHALTRGRRRSIVTSSRACAPSVPAVIDYEEGEDDAGGGDQDDASAAPDDSNRPHHLHRYGDASDDEPDDRDCQNDDIEPDDDDDDDNDLSDAESFTLKDRQQAINETHPFGIRLWKPALYKKDRSVQRTAEGDIHSTPGGHVSHWLLFFNIIWTLAFGWWMALIAYAGAAMCFLFAAAPSARQYGRVLWGLAGYLFYPFGKFIRLEQQEAYRHEDQGEGRSISEYEQWQSGDLEYGRLFFGPQQPRSIVGRSRRSLDSDADETESLLGRQRRREPSISNVPHTIKRRLFGRGQWNIGRVIFFLFFYLLITPSLFIVSGVCWFLVFWIPIGKVTMLLFRHLRRHPLALSFEFDTGLARHPTTTQSSILVCTYRAVGWKYWKYTIDGTNIFFINLMAVVIFVIVDWLVLAGVLHLDNFIVSPAFLFVASLFSIIPLAYFIGQAVASISAQSSMGVGAAINAFFSTIVEVFLYCVALSQGKGALVEGSIIGSIFAGILFLPGLSMCFGAIKRKTQRFNAQSAGVTSTMLLFAVICAFGPTLFYQIYGTHELICMDCINLDYPSSHAGPARDCRRCYYSQSPTLTDRFYLEAVRPFCYLAACLLFLSYVIGLWFTLRTHAAVIWSSEVDEKKHDDHAATAVVYHHSTLPKAPTPLPPVGDSTAIDVRDSPLFRRVLAQSLRQAGLAPVPGEFGRQPSSTGLKTAGPTLTNTPHVVPPKPVGSERRLSVTVPGLSGSDNNTLLRQVAEIAAAAATFAARDARNPRRTTTAQGGAGGGGGSSSPVSGAAPMTATTNRAPAVPQVRTAAVITDTDDVAEHQVAAAAAHAEHGSHDAPNWSKTKSAIILMGATVLYAIIAEILVDTVDVVLGAFAIDEKFLGITLFALVPNTTEFLNAISFAMNGNIALSMEIGSAYALQVCLLQVPALVLFSAIFGAHYLAPGGDIAAYSFSLLFPQWDIVSVILCVFLLSYMYGEGKSNYFKGSILLLSYLVVVIGYYLSGVAAGMDQSGAAAADSAGWMPSRFDTLTVDGKWTSHALRM